MIFADNVDKMLAHTALGVVFTKNHEGYLQFDLSRTRDWRRRKQQEDAVFTLMHQHCVCIDIATGWPMYVLFTARELCVGDAQTNVIICASYEDALQRLEQEKQLYFESKT